MNLSAPLLVEDPIERLFAYHRRAERQMAALGRLPVHVELSGVDAEAIAIADSALHCFGPGLDLHREEEERDVLPLLERRIVERGAIDAFRALRSRIELDHYSLEQAWQALRRPLAAIAEGVLREVPARELACFRALSALHISVEEPELHTLAARHLRPEDREALARRMHARRAAIKPSFN